MAYTPYHLNWHNQFEATDTPITAEFLEYLEGGVVSSAAIADAAVPKSTVTNAGDIVIGTAPGTVNRLPLGGPGTVLKGGVAAPSYGQVTNTEISDVSPSKLTGYPGDITKALLGDGSWGSLGTVDLAYAEFTSNVSITAVTEATANTIVTAAAFTADGSTAYMISFYCPDLITTSDSVAVNVWLYQDGTSIGKIGTRRTQASAVTMDGSITCSRRMIPAAGARTYSVRASRGSAGTSTASAGAGGSSVLMPGYIRIVRA